MKTIIIYLFTLVQPNSFFVFYFIYFIMFQAAFKPNFFVRDTFPGFYKPKAKNTEQKKVGASTPSNNPEEEKKKKEEEKKKEEDLKKLIDRLWVASSIAAIIIVTWTIYKHLSK
jgi:hypothetical protein